MKTIEELEKSGRKLTACSANGTGHVSSYIAKVAGRKVYGSWSYATKKYVEEPA